jgi:hypothetical protein
MILLMCVDYDEQEITTSARIEVIRWVCEKLHSSLRSKFTLKLLRGTGNGREDLYAEHTPHGHMAV